MTLRHLLRLAAVARRALVDLAVEALAKVDVPEPYVAAREVCGPGVASARPVPASWEVGAIGGVTFRRPCCGVCRRPVDLTLEGDDSRTVGAAFYCDRCEAYESLQFAEPEADADVALLLGCMTPFVGGEPS